jgi:tRNA G18 (ribose-2'-O)-methylase SpoU
VPRFIPIEDADDSRIEGYRAVRERDLAGRHGLFVAEGEVVLRVLARSAVYEPDSVLLAEKRVEALRPLLEPLPAATPVYTAAQPVLDAIVGFHIHRGVLALGRRGTPPEAEALLAGLGPEALVVALFGIGNHDNMGGLFRNAAAFGADAVLLDPACCDPLYRKAIRVSVGAALSTSFAWLRQGEDALDLLERHGFTALGLSPAGKVRLADLRRPRRAALLLGSEGPGLPASVLDRATTVTIPMAGAFDSLNVATTCGIALHHLMFAAEPEA